MDNRVRDTTKQKTNQRNKHIERYNGHLGISIYSSTKNDGTVDNGYSGYRTSGIDLKTIKRFRQVPNPNRCNETSSD